MTDNMASIRQRLKDCELPQLFIEELGWNHHRAAPLIVATDGASYTLNAVAEKHGMVAYRCEPGLSGEIPDYCLRGKIERQATKSAHEHIIVFVNGDKTVQTWQWVRRERGRPAARREHTYVNTQPGDSLIQKLQAMAVSLEEEEMLTIVGVADKVRQAFDVDRVTKRFYERFKDEHARFLGFIQGITVVADREWYASLMLNRLMFIYFIQKKRFLDGDPDYLRRRLKMVQEQRGHNQFHTFYRYFLLRLFHEGLGQRKEDRAPELDSLLGNVPYLNGGLFDTHQLERDNPAIHIPDEAFERLFDFFDAYQWHLEDRPLRADNEINPDVLGYIFEKYINQKQMGAYYTKEDITEYISKSTIIPFLFDAAEKQCAIAFRPDGAVWRLLRDDPDRYIYEAVRKGVDLPLPPEIDAGISDVSKRGGWNRPAEAEFALPTETWREHVARRTRCLELRAKLAAGELHNINDLVTYNLDLRQFAQDVTETCEGPDLLRAFWHTIRELSVLDPTCGSGAFLFAALNILEPLYEACLNRMEAFVAELDGSGEKHHPEKFSDFRKVIDHANDKSKHPSRRYFVLKSIVLGNLYGVDIMEEAVEICKLRLFLKLVAQVERVEDVEPLPDIDFNIRAGNTLVGFTSLEAVQQAMTIMPNGQHRMLSAEDQAILKRIGEDAEVADWAFQQFKESQSGLSMNAGDFTTGKELVRESLHRLRERLDRYLATEYGIELRDTAAYDRWRASHQPFHWFAEFYGAMNNGGFDVVIGNPPYIEYSKVKDSYTVHGYHTASCGNVYAFIIERALLLSQRGGRSGLIVPLSLVCTGRMAPLRKVLYSNCERVWFDNFDTIPSTLFTGIVQRNTVLITIKSTGKPVEAVYATGLQKWYVEERPVLMGLTSFARLAPEPPNSLVPKISSSFEHGILSKIHSQKCPIMSYVVENSNNTLVYKRRWSYFLLFADHLENIILPDGSTREQQDLKTIHLSMHVDRNAFISILSSGAFYFHYCCYSDFRHVNISDFEMFYIDYLGMQPALKAGLGNLAKDLMRSYAANLEWRSCNYTGSIGECSVPFYRQGASKPIIDEIDQVLAKHYGFTTEELDFIINYDIKYRMGQDSEEDGSDQ